ncbi:MAG: DUF2164 domain-containing protein [Acidobacteriota bacterium]
MATMRIQIDGERRKDLLREIEGYFSDAFDENISAFQAEGLLDFFVEKLGPPVYNQAIRDAHAFLQNKLADLEGDFYEPES